MEWLLPDWTYSPLKGRVERHDYLRQSRPKIELSIFRCRYETWNIFKQHHYLTEDLNKAAKCFVILWNDKPMGFVAILPSPSGTIENQFRVSRLVILPDFQGLGIGIKLLNYLGALYKSIDKELNIKTSNPALFLAMNYNKNNWKLTQELTLEQIKKFNNNRLIKDKNASSLELYKESATKSYRYIGEKSTDDLSLIKFKGDAYKDVSQNQINLF